MRPPLRHHIDLLAVVAAAVGVGQLRHGSEGWKCLETSMKALQQLMEGTGPVVAPLITDDVMDLIYRWDHWSLSFHKLNLNS